MDGILNVYKEAGYTSHDVVAKLRGILGAKKDRTIPERLNPAAGPVSGLHAVGKATRKICEAADQIKDQTYQAVMPSGCDYGFTGCSR